MRPLFFSFFFILYLPAQEHNNLSVETIDGEDILLAELIQQGPVLVNFWALWCEPCKLEMKQLESLYQKFKDKNFSVLAINRDNQKSISKVSSYISSQEFSFLVATDPDGEIAQQFNVQNIPFSILFDKNGNIVYKAIGYKPGDELQLEKTMEKLLMVENGGDTTGQR